MAGLYLYLVACPGMQPNIEIDFLCQIRQEAVPARSGDEGMKK